MLIAEIEYEHTHGRRTDKTQSYIVLHKKKKKKKKKKKLLEREERCSESETERRESLS